MIKRRSLLHQYLHRNHPLFYPVHQFFYIRCFAHVLNLAVRDFVSTIHTRIEKIRSFLAAIRSPVRRQDLFEAVRVQFYVQCESPSLNCESRWSSTVIMIEQAFKARYFFNRIISKCLDLARPRITEAEWKSGRLYASFWRLLH